MAVSTISSVTWASNVFTDGTPIETDAEESIEIISDGEAEEFDENELLTTYQSLGTAWETIGDKWKTRDGVCGVKSDGKDGYCIEVKPGLTVPCTASSSLDKAATCKTPKLKGYTFTLPKEYNDSYIYSAYLVVTDGWVEGSHENLLKTNIVDTDWITDVNGEELTACERYQKYFSYQYCPTCGGLLLTNGNVASTDTTFGMLKIVDKYGNPGDLPDGATFASVSELLGLLESDTSKLKYEDLLVSFKNAGVVFEEGTRNQKSHIWVENIKSVIPPDEYKSERFIDGYPGLVQYGAYRTYVSKNSTKYTLKADGKTLEVNTNGQTELELYAKKANCQLNSNGDPMGFMSPNQDSFYYIYNECSVCGKTSNASIEVFYHADMKEGTTVYKTGSNVVGFVKKNTDGSLSKYVDKNGNYITVIPKDDLYDVILGDCTKPGEYFLCDVGPNGSMVKQTPIQKPAGHTYDRIKLKLVESGSNRVGRDVLYANEHYGIVAGHSAQETSPYNGEIAYYVEKEYDENHNVTAVHDKDCVADGYYDLEQVCFGCGHDNLLENGSNRKTVAGDHVWTNLGVDSVKVDRTPIDEKHHLEEYYDNLKCTICGKTDQKKSVIKPSAVVNHKFYPDEIKDSRVEPKCNEDGSFKRADMCACGYVDESTTTTVAIPNTDKHDFGTNQVELNWTEGVYINGSFVNGASICVTVARKCIICGEYDSNGINTVLPTAGEKNNELVITNVSNPIKLKVDSIVPAKKDSNGVTLPCSTSTARVYVDWVGTVDGKKVEKSEERVDVPYYEDIDIYRGRTAHRWDSGVRTEYTAPTETTDGKCTIVYTCEVCGETKTVHQDIPKLDPTVVPATPTVQAVSAGYNSINVSWNAVDGADHYRLYYKSADLGVVSWKLLKTVTGTSFAHTGLVTGAKYRYTVRAVQNGVKGDYSKTGSVAVPKLAAPENITVTAASGKNKVSWSKVDGANGYIIQRSTGNGWTRVGSVKKGAKVTWTDKKPVSGATYRVRAYRTVNDANFSKNNVYSAFSAAK